MRDINVQPVQYEQEGASRKYEYLRKMFWGLFSDHCLQNAKVKTPGHCCLPLADCGKVWGWDVQPGPKMCWEHQSHQMKTTPPCSEVMWWGLILPCNTTTPEIQDFVLLPQIKFIINLYSSGWPLSRAVPRFCFAPCLETACLQVWKRKAGAQDCLHRRVLYWRTTEQLCMSMPSAVTGRRRWFRCKKLFYVSQIYYWNLSFNKLF